jgi:hypothetical protein
MSMDSGFFKDDDLADLFAELEMEDDKKINDNADKEMDASTRRYKEIIKKHNKDSIEDNI